MINDIVLQGKMFENGEIQLTKIVVDNEKEERYNLTDYCTFETPIAIGDIWDDPNSFVRLCMNAEVKFRLIPA